MDADLVGPSCPGAGLHERVTAQVSQHVVLGDGVTAGADDGHAGAAPGVPAYGRVDDRPAPCSGCPVTAAR